MKLLIIGGVAAGATAAARARRMDEEVDITLLEAGPDVSFANCGLPYYIGGEVKHRSSLILQSPQSFHDQYNLEVHTETQVLEIEREKKRVRALHKPSGEIRFFPYDKLILAQGGKPIIPPFPGVQSPHVFQLWTLEDMDKIDRYIREEQPQQATVVGGGFIGLEMVEALANRGLEVTLVEKAPHLMPNLEGEMAGYFTQVLQSHGVEVMTGVGLSQIHDNYIVLESGEQIPTQMVLLSIGVKPTLQLALDAGLSLGETGGLLVDHYLRTSDPNIWAAGDMVEIEHQVLGTKVRIPLAGPANRQGRIAATNALGGQMKYRGSGGTSILKAFQAQGGSTGLSLSQGVKAGINAQAVVTHKYSHTAYYPGSAKVSLMMIYDQETGKILGAQAVGEVGVDKRLDVMATAILGGLTIDDLSEVDLAYAPPFNSPNGPVHMSAFTASNRRSGHSPSILASELDQFILEGPLFILDLRDPISYGKGHVAGSVNWNQKDLRSRGEELPRERRILLISEDGQKGHLALRALNGMGFHNVFNMSGGFISLERHQRALGFKNIEVPLLPIEKEQKRETKREEEVVAAESIQDALEQSKKGKEPLIIDVRTEEEFSYGAYPGAINIPLDELPVAAGNLGEPGRAITLYCASGARSAYGMRILNQMGYVNVKNGGGLGDMLSKA